MKKILIIDDELHLVEALKLKLTAACFDVATAHNGESALDFLTKNQVDIVLLDIIMPKLDGFGFLDALRRKGISVPIIVLSNLGQPEDIERSKKYDDVKDFFVKADTSLDYVAKRISELI